MHSFEQPFFLSIGPQRAGTSWLERYLRARGDVCLPNGVKEIFFFDKNSDKSSEFYFHHFKPEPQHKIIMEVTTTAFDYEPAPERVFKTLGPDLRLLCPLRDPIIRSYSLYVHSKRYGLVTGSLQDACKQDPHILESSHYAKHLLNWYKFYKPEQIKIVFQEELELDQDQYLQTVCLSLGLEYMKIPEELRSRYNAGTQSVSPIMASATQRVADWLRSHKLYSIINFGKTLGLKNLIFGQEQQQSSENFMSDQDRSWLEERLRPEISKLEEIIGPIPYWKK